MPSLLTNQLHFPHAGGHVRSCIVAVAVESEPVTEVEIVLALELELAIEAEGAVEVVFDIVAGLAVGVGLELEIGIGNWMGLSYTRLMDTFLARLETIANN